MTKVVLRPNESQEGLLKRFRRTVIRDRVLSEVRKRRWYVSPSEERRIAKKKAIRRLQRKRRRNENHR